MGRLSTGEQPHPDHIENPLRWRRIRASRRHQSRTRISIRWLSMSSIRNPQTSLTRSPAAYATRNSARYFGDFTAANNRSVHRRSGSPSSCAVPSLAAGQRLLPVARVCGRTTSALLRDKRCGCALPRIQARRTSPAGTETLTRQHSAAAKRLGSTRVMRSAAHGMRVTASGRLRVRVQPRARAPVPSDSLI